MLAIQIDAKRITREIEDLINQTENSPGNINAVGHIIFREEDVELNRRLQDPLSPSSLFGKVWQTLRYRKKTNVKRLFKGPLPI
ncbi:MAG: hypothetical protein KDB03_15200 [Planctomycetales bacterium]|nr:hypothetical protein [Planctomycetales bacterium]